MFRVITSSSSGTVEKSDGSSDKAVRRANTLEAKVVDTAIGVGASIFQAPTHVKICALATGIGSHLDRLSMRVDSHLKKTRVDGSVQCGVLSMEVRVARAEKRGREEWKNLEHLLQGYARWLSYWSLHCGYEVGKGYEEGQEDGAKPSVLMTAAAG